MKNIQNLTIDINKKPFQTITANVGEVASRFVRISIVDKSTPVDLTGVTVSLYAKKPDGNKVFNNVTIEDKTNGIILAELTSQVLAVEGLVKLTLLLVKNGGKLCSKQFLLNVDSSIVDDEAIESTNEFTALVDALSRVNNIDSRFENVSSQLEHIENNVVIINNSMIINEINEKLKSGGTFIFKNGTYLINKGETIKVCSNSKLYFEPNAILKYNDYSSSNYVILTVANCKNVVIEGVNIVGCRDNHIGVDGEWGYGIEITASKNIKIIRPCVEKTWGDGIYIGYKWDETNPMYITSNIQILDSHIYKCSRNGIAICSGDDILIDKALIKEVDRCNPMAGIDIEPECGNKNVIHLSNIILKDITTIKNSVGIGLVCMDDYDGCQNMNVKIYNHINYDSQGVAIWADGGCPFKFIIDGAKYYNTEYNAIKIDNSHTSSTLIFKNIDIIDKTISSIGSDYSMHSAILVNGSVANDSYGNLVFRDISIDTSNCDYHFTNIIAFENAIGNSASFYYTDITIDNVVSVGGNDGSYKLTRIDSNTLKFKNCDANLFSNYYIQTLNRDFYTTYTYTTVSDWNKFYIDSGAIDGIYTIQALSNADNYSIEITPKNPVTLANNKSYYILRLGEVRFYKKGNKITFLDTAINGGFID